MVVGMEKSGGSTSPSKVYAKRERTADFLLGERSVELDPQISEIGLELLRRLEDDPGHAKALSRLNISSNIVNVNGFLGPDLAGMERFAVNDWVRLAGTYSVGVDTNGKEAEEGEARLLMGHMDRVGVREQGQAVLLGKFLQKRLGMNGIRVKGEIPDFAELLESKRGAKTFG